MVSKGTFGYIIGRKKCFMRVNTDAELLWQILVREIYVIMKYFGNKDLIQEAFEKIKVIKRKNGSYNLPKQTDIQKYKKFTNMESEINDWENILYFCQSSFINLLECGHILLEKEEEPSGYHFEFDLNKWEARFYWKKDLYECANLEEIMNFEEMPLKTYIEIVEEMNNRFTIYYDKVMKTEIELEKLYKLKSDARSQGAVNIEEKVDKLIDDMKWELKEIHMSRREFYHQLKALDLIEIHL